MDIHSFETTVECCDQAAEVLLQQDAHIGDRILNTRRIRRLQVSRHYMNLKFGQVDPHYSNSGVGSLRIKP